MGYQGPRRTYTAANSETTAIGQFGRDLAKKWLQREKFKGLRIDRLKGDWKKLDGDFRVVEGRQLVCTIRVKTENVVRRAPDKTWPSIFVEEFVDRDRKIPGWSECKADKAVYQILSENILLYIDLRKFRDWLRIHRNAYLSQEQSKTQQWNHVVGQRIPIDDLLDAGEEYAGMVELVRVKFPAFEWIPGVGIGIETPPKTTKGKHAEEGNPASDPAGSPVVKARRARTRKTVQADPRPVVAQVSRQS